MLKTLNCINKSFHNNLKSFVRTLAYHSKVKEVTNPIMDVKIIPALDDNYMYLIIDKATREAAVVDPVEPEKVYKAVENEDVNLTTILTTHHHWDHAGGHEKILSKLKDLKVYGNDDRIFGQNKQVQHDVKFSLGELSIRPFLTPCHTTGHVCYYVEDEKHPSVFTGDTLFLAGCGRFFEGNGAQMYHALVDVLSKLPANTNVYCGHEYSVGSLTFAKHVQPDNEAVDSKLKWAKEQRSKGLTCIPSLMSEEMSYNPFMRVNEPSMMKRCGTKNGVETMDYLRNEKDHFKSKV